MANMYSVGSVGTVDPADAGKVVFAGSVAQLSGNRPGKTEPAQADTPEVILFPTVSATIRYEVTPDSDGAELGSLMLLLRYSPGQGGVLATLTEVPILLFDPHDPGTVTETALLQFDSADFERSAGFQTKLVGGPTGPTPNHVLDFTNNVYYIAVLLTLPEFPSGIPPAVSAIQLAPWQQF
jgi:hypothetical protein